MRVIGNLAILAMLFCIVSADVPQEQVQRSFEAAAYNNDTVSEIIEQLIQSRREGRNLDDTFNQVYADGNIDQALMQGNDVEARNLIRDKLCEIGLMSCENEAKRPYYSTIYAQEMPPPPQNFRGRPPLRPLQPPLRPPSGFGPPPRVGYEGPFKPSGPNGPYLGPVYESPPPGATVIYGNKPPGSIFTGSSPVDPPPYAFESTPPNNKVHISSSVTGSSQSNYYTQQAPDSVPAPSTVFVGNNADAGLQQHVHHHFHHLEGSASPIAKVPAVTIPVGGAQTVSTDFATLAQSSSAFNLDHSSAYAAGFNGASQGGLLAHASEIGEFGAPVHKPNGEIYKPLPSFNALPGTHNELYQPSTSGFSGSSGFNSFGANSGSYHSQNPDYHKKELHNYGGLSSASSSSLNSISGGYAGNNQFNGYTDTSRQQFVDCQCVPAHQCPTADRIGRKEDLILAIDPRNLHKDIEALNDLQDQNSTESSSTDKSKQAEIKEDDVPKRAKRDTKAADKADDEDVNIPVDAEGRQSLLNLPAIELLRRKVLPTYGVSFGLPSPSVGYPANALGDYVPARNPYFGAIGPDGLNLGLLNVNPLLSVQVVKTEFGDKVVKPLVNLHITPTSNAIKNVGELFKRRPDSHAQHNTHYHHHQHYTEHQYADHSGFYEPYHSSPYPYEIIDMVHSKPILEYHTTSSEPYFSTEYGHVPDTYTHYDNNFHNPSYNYFEPIVHQNIHHYDEHDYVPNDNHHSLYDDQHYDYGFDRSSNISVGRSRHGKQLALTKTLSTPAPDTATGSDHITFPKDRRRRSIEPLQHSDSDNVLAQTVQAEERAYYGNRPPPQPRSCRINEVCCRRPLKQVPSAQFGRCGVRNAAGITGRIKNPVYVDGDAEFGEYPWHVAILKKDPNESIYACGGTLIDAEHVITAAHCIKSQNGFELRARLGEWDVNHDVEFFPYIERDIVAVNVHPEYYAGTLDNDLAVLKLDHPVDFAKNPHISPACLPDKFTDWTGARCWTTGWGKDAFGEHGKYQNILKEVDVPILSHHQCETQLRQTRLGYGYKLNPGFLCAGGEEGKDACKGDGGGPLVCERNGVWNAVGIVSWGIGCGQVNVPGVYVRVAHYLDWINQITHYYKK